MTDGVVEVVLKLSTCRNFEINPALEYIIKDLHNPKGGDNGGPDDARQNGTVKL